jgi:hypothetical protein
MVAVLDKGAFCGTSGYSFDARLLIEARCLMPGIPRPEEPAPSPKHYWDTVKGCWRLRLGNRKQDPNAAAERLLQLQLEAKARPPRTKPWAPDALQRKTMSQLIDELPRQVGGEHIPASPPPSKYPDPPRDYEESVERLRLFGLDNVLALTEEGHSNREVCLRVGTRPNHLSRWIASIEAGETRAREAKRKAAQAWVDRGLAALENATGALELAKAREIALMCRKYAALCDPSYSDRVQVDTTVKAEDPGSIDARLRLLVADVGQKALKVAHSPTSMPQEGSNSTPSNDLRVLDEDSDA